MLLKATHFHWVGAGKEQYNCLITALIGFLYVVQLDCDCTSLKRRPPLTSSTKSEPSKLLMWWMTSNRWKNYVFMKSFFDLSSIKMYFLHGQRRCKLELIFPGTWCSIFLQFIFKCSFRWQGQLSGEREAATNVTNIRNQGKRRQIEIYTEYICRVRPTFGEREREDLELLLFICISITTARLCGT